MNIFKQIVAILVVSFVCGIGFNCFSPHGINIFDNPWAKKYTNEKTSSIAGDSENAEDDPIIFVKLDRAKQFVENKEGIVLDARKPEDYAEGHIAGAYLLSFYCMNDYYPGLKDRLMEASAILVYCGGVDCEDSEFLANELFNSGCVSILVYKGGFEEWSANQLPVEKGMGGR